MELAKLSSRFFIEHPVQETFYRRWRSLYTWSHTCMPVYEWEGMLFVAFSTPEPPKIKSGIPLVFVHTASDALAKAHEKLLNKLQAKAPKPESALPEGLDLDLSAKTRDIPVGEFTAEEIEKAPAAPTAVDENDLFDLQDHPAPAASANQAPEGVDLQMNSSPDSGKLELNPEGPAEEVRENTVDMEIAPPAEHWVVEEKQAPAAAKPVKTGTGRFKIGRTSTGIKVPPPSNPQASADAAKTEQTMWFQKLFEQMEFHYKKSMILLLDNGKAVPWKWSNRFRPRGSKAEPVELDFPSPFRVAFKTQKAYHGEVIPTDVGDKFFFHWNQGENPDHLTIAPIIEGDKLVGFLLATGDVGANNKNSLSLSEKLAFELGVSFKINPELFVAA